MYCLIEIIFATRWASIRNLIFETDFSAEKSFNSWQKQLPQIDSHKQVFFDREILTRRLPT